MSLDTIGEVGEIVERRTLEQLAKTINEECRLADSAFSAGVAHAIRCGHALIEAKETVPPGHWLAWLAERIDIMPQTIWIYMRFARNEHLLAGFEGTIAGAKRLLTYNQVPSPKGTGPDLSFDRDLALEMYRSGLTIGAVARALGVGDGSVRRVLDPDYSRRQDDRARKLYFERKAARAALIERQRAEAVRRLSGDASHIYASTRKNCQLVESLIAASDDRDYKAAMRDVYNALTRVEAAILKALNVK